MAKASSVFQAKLDSLCLHQFPCGYNKWHPKERKKYIKGEIVYHESIDSLKELLNSAAWKSNFEWSREASELRELTIKSPWLIDDEFVKKYFKTLRLVNEKISQVDEGILYLVNLEELTLSANDLVNVESRYLPLHLQVLELCANQISDLASLCRHPPPLRHLGLSYNRISSLHNYFSPSNWPYLLSLDLSYNNLTSLSDVMATLALLPKLRNLILQGNPLSLSPAYRGAFIDAIRSLTSLDDVLITADEKHHFKGLSKCKDPLLNGACLFVRINSLNNLKMPDELKNRDPHPVYPIIEYKYTIEFTIAEEYKQVTDQIPTFHSGRLYKSLTTEENVETTSKKHDRRRNRNDKNKLKRQESPKQKKQDTDLKDDELFDEAFKAELPVPEAVHTQPSKFLIDRKTNYPAADILASMNRSRSNAVAAQEIDKGQDKAGMLTGDDRTWIALNGISSLPIKVHSASTQAQPWSLKMDYYFEYVFTCYNLAHLRDYLAQGVTFAIVENRRYGFANEGEANNFTATRSQQLKEIDSTDASLRPRSASSNASRNEKAQYKAKKEGAHPKKDRDKEHNKDQHAKEKDNHKEKDSHKEQQKERESSKDPSKDSPKDVKKARRKDRKQTDERSLFYTPVESKRIAIAHLSLESIWDGETSLQATCTFINLEEEEQKLKQEQQAQALSADLPAVDVVDVSKRKNSRRNETIDTEPNGIRLNKRRDSNEKASLGVDKKLDEGRLRRSSFTKDEDKSNEANSTNARSGHATLKIDDKSASTRRPSMLNANKAVKNKNEEKNKRNPNGQKVDSEEEIVITTEVDPPVSLDTIVKLLRWKTAVEAYENKIWELAKKEEAKQQQDAN